MSQFYKDGGDLTNSKPQRKRANGGESASEWFSRKFGSRYDKPYVMKRSPILTESYQAPLPSEVIENNEEAGFDGRLQGAPAYVTYRRTVTPGVKGNVTQAMIDSRRLPFYHPVGDYMINNPGKPVYQSATTDLDRQYYQSRPAVEVVKPDLSNLRRGMSFSTLDPNKYSWDLIQSKGADIEETDILPRAVVRNPEEAATVFAQEQSLKDAFDDWGGYVRANPYLRSIYRTLTDGSTDIQDAAKIMRAARERYGDDWHNVINYIMPFFDNGQHGQTYEALGSLFGYTHPVGAAWSPDRRQALWGANVDRLANAIKAAHRYFSINDGEDPRQYQRGTYKTISQEDADQELYDGMINGFKPQTPSNSYSRGGRLRVPKRNSYGDRVSRADNLGTDEYDVYF